MLILLKTTCFGLWFFMMMLLIFADKAKSRQVDLFTLQLDDPNQAERQIYDSLRKLKAGAQLHLEIAACHPDCPELTRIASRINRKNPAILFQVSGLSGT